MRESKEIIIEEGRDAGKRFRITEMGAFEAEELFIEAALLLSRAVGKSGGMPPTVKDKASFILTMAGHVDKGELKPLLDRLMKQVVYIDEDNRPRQIQSAGIEDVTTLLRLRKEVVALHISFLPPANPLRAVFTAAGAESL